MVETLGAAYRVPFDADGGARRQDDDRNYVSPVMTAGGSIWKGKR